MVVLNDLHFAYARKKVLEGLNMTFHAGHIYGVLGKNGTGKSTLLSLLAGLLFPGRGSITIHGYSPAKRQPFFLSNIFLVPEEFYLPDFSLADFIEYYSPFYPKFDKGVFFEYTGAFDIPDHSMQSMSYGQRKKVLISFALATNASLVLFDEPTNGLDIVSKIQLKKVMARAFQDDKCFIISTHQVRDIETLIDRLLILDEGKIILDQSMEVIAQKLLFKISFDPSENTLFREPLLRGYATVAENNTGEESKIDLELLYKAILENPAVIPSIFNVN